MTDLQMGLIGLGGAAVIGVLVYNKWQEHKHRKLAEQVLSSRQTDVLLEETSTGERSAASDLEVEAPGSGRRAGSAVSSGSGSAGGVRVEPLLRGEVNSSALAPELRRTGAASGQRQPPAFLTPGEATAVTKALPGNAVAPIQEEAAVTTNGSAPLYLLSPLIDCIAAIDLAEPASAYRIREGQRTPLLRIGKAVNWIGFNEESREWEPIDEDSDRSYRRIGVGLQLVDRKGPLRDDELAVFGVAMADLADELIGVAEVPLRDQVLMMAAELDAFCAGVDIQIGVNVISQGQVFPGTKLRALAESAGMVLDGEGRFVRCDDDGNVLYVLINQEARHFSVESMRSLSTHGVTFLLDVPCVANGDRVLTQMVELARRFAEALHGAVVDDNRRPLSDAALEPIRRQIVQYQAAMAQRELPAGGALAQRLFS